MSLNRRMEPFREARPDWPSGWTQGPNISGGQKTARSNAESFGDAVGFVELMCPG